MIDSNAIRIVKDIIKERIATGMYLFGEMI